MKENYIYPAIFSKGEEGETEIRFVDFPDILTYSETDDIDDVVRTAQDILALTIMDYEAEKRELPKPSSDIKGAAYIHIWMPYFRNNIKEIYVKNKRKERKMKRKTAGKREERAKWERKPA